MGLEGIITNTPVRDVLRALLRNAGNGKLVVWNEQEWALVWIMGGHAVSAVVLRKADRRPLHTGEQAVFNLLNWSEGSYSFSPDSESVNYPVTIKRPTGTLIVEALQRSNVSDEVVVSDYMLKAPLKLLPQFVGANNRVQLSMDEWYLLAHIGQESTAEQLAEQTGLPAARVLLIVSRLVDYGLVMRALPPQVPQMQAVGGERGIILNNLMRALRRRLQQFPASA